jgi:hypothetical protein
MVPVLLMTPHFFQDPLSMHDRNPDTDYLQSLTNSGLKCFLVSDTRPACRHIRRRHVNYNELTTKTTNDFQRITISTTLSNLDLILHHEDEGFVLLRFELNFLMYCDTAFDCLEYENMITSFKSCCVLTSTSH